MGVSKVPEYYLFVCDGCRKSLQQATAHRPAHWSHLTLARHAYDYQGCAVADGTTQRLLCGDCTEKIATAINDAFPEI